MGQKARHEAWGYSVGNEVASEREKAASHSCRDSDSCDSVQGSRECLIGRNLSMGLWGSQWLEPSASCWTRRIVGWELSDRLNGMSKYSESGCLHVLNKQLIQDMVWWSSGDEGRPSGLRAGPFWRLQSQALL